MSAIIIRGEDIRRARKARGMTLEAASAILGTTKGVLSDWENNKRQPRLKAAERLAFWLAQKPESISEKGTSSSLTTCSLPLPPKLADIAAELGVDIVQLYATIGTEAVRAELKRLWKEANAEAIRQHNAYIDQYGIPFSDMRVW
jgi:transcriptional regulator with XRE-family HTH domain